MYRPMFSYNKPYLVKKGFLKFRAENFRSEIKISIFSAILKL